MEDAARSAREFTPNARWFLLASFLFWSQHFVQGVLFNLYLREAGLREGYVGRVAAVWALGLAAGTLPSGWLNERFGRRATVLAASLVGCLALEMRALSLAPGMLYGMSFIYGAAFSVLQVSTPTFLAENSLPRERTQLFGVHFAVSLSAGLVGSLLGGRAPEWLQMFAHLGALDAYRIALVSASALGLLGLLPLLRLTDPEPEEEPQAPVAAHARGRHVAIFAWNYLLIGLGAGFVIPFFNLYFVQRFHSTSGQIGLFFSSAQVVTALAGLAGPPLARRFGLVRTVAFLQLASLPFLLSLSVESYLPLAVLSFWMRSTLMQTASPLTSALLMELTEPARRTRVLAMCTLLWDLGWSAGSYCGGQMMQHVSYELPYWVTAGFYAVASVSFYWFLRWHKDAKHEPVDRARM